MMENGSLDIQAAEAQKSLQEWETRDAYLSNVPEEDRSYVYCDHCRATLVVRPFLIDGELYMECQVCKFTYKNNGVMKEVLRTISDH